MKAINIGKSRQVFWDEYLVDTEKTSAAPRVNRPVEKECCFVFDEKDEMNSISYPCVVKDDKGYKIDKIVDGETVADVLSFVQYNPKQMVRRLEVWAKQSVKEGKITLEEGKEFLSTYRSGLYGYTYLE